MRRYLDLTSWVLLFFFAPFTVLILLSQNTIPGDFFYPVKRGLENMILVAASVSPTTKVAFRTDLTQRRFSEAQQLLVSKADTSAYNQFIDEVFIASQDLSKLSDSSDRIEKSEKLLIKIEEYKTQLAQVGNQVQIAQALPQQVPGQTPFPTTAVQTPRPEADQPVAETPTQQPTSSPRAGLTPTPVAPSPAQAPSVSIPVPSVAPTTVPTTPPLAPTVTNVIATNPIKAEEVKEKLKSTIEHLDKAEKELKKAKEEAQVEEKAKEERKKLREGLEREEKKDRNNGENDN